MPAPQIRLLAATFALTIALALLMVAAANAAGPSDASRYGGHGQNVDKRHKEVYDGVWRRRSPRRTSAGPAESPPASPVATRRPRRGRPLPRRLPVLALDLAQLPAEPGWRPDRLQLPDPGIRRRPAEDAGRRGPLAQLRLAVHGTRSRGVQRDIPMSNFEVVRSDVDGWDVRRVGEARRCRTTPRGSWPRRPPNKSRMPRTSAATPTRSTYARTCSPRVPRRTSTRRRRSSARAP